MLGWAESEDGGPRERDKGWWMVVGVDHKLGIASQRGPTG